MRVLCAAACAGMIVMGFAWGGDEEPAHHEICPHIGEPEESPEIVERVARCVVRNGLERPLTVHIWVVSGVSPEAEWLERVNWFDRQLNREDTGFIPEMMSTPLIIRASEARGWRMGLGEAFDHGVRPRHCAVWSDGGAGVEPGEVSIEAESLREDMWAMIVIGRDAWPEAMRVHFGQFTRSIAAEGKDIGVVFFNTKRFDEARAETR